MRDTITHIIAENQWKIWQKSWSVDSFQFFRQSVRPLIWTPVTYIVGHHDSQQRLIVRVESDIERGRLEQHEASMQNWQQLSEKTKKNWHVKITVHTFFLTREDYRSYLEYETNWLILHWQRFFKAGFFQICHWRFPLQADSSNYKIRRKGYRHKQWLE